MRKNIVFNLSFFVIVIFAVVAIFFQDLFNNISNIAFSFLTDKFSWLYLITMLFFVIFVIYIAFSKYGNIRLGKESEKPEYSTFSWFAMLFCAGMGVGLVFWGISEPVTHFISPPDSIDAASVESARFAFRSSFMHWGIHPWANYAVVGLALAYFQFKKGMPGLISSAVTPILGEKKIGRIIGTIIDVFAAFATIAGIVTSLGLGVLQINSGLNNLFEIPNNLIVEVLIIVAVTIVFVTSAISGISKGVKKLSDFNIVLAAILMILTFFVGPKLEIVNNMVTGIGDYIQNFFSDSLLINSYSDSSWVKGWRVFYWAWWIAWAPFVGLFIARISKGRTVREFILGVVLAPTVASIVWFSVFGTMGVSLGMNNKISPEMLSQIGSIPEEGLFIVLKNYPLGVVLSILGVILLLTFFITSADSGTYVLSMLTSDGNMNPSNIKKIVWGILQSVLAIGLLMAGGLKPLQTISIVAAFPFMIIMIFICVSLIKAFRSDVDQ